MADVRAFIKYGILSKDTDLGPLSKRIQVYSSVDQNLGKVSPPSLKWNFCQKEGKNVIQMLSNLLSTDWTPTVP